MCNKKPYETFWLARAAMTALRAKQGGQGSPSGVHPCSACRGWHVTSHGGYVSPPWRTRRPVT